jgi:hypothetical protein
VERETFSNLSMQLTSIEVIAQKLVITMTSCKRFIGSGALDYKQAAIDLFKGIA